MTKDPENLVLVDLRRMDQRLERIEGTLGEHGRRLTRIEDGLARTRRDQAADAETVAHLQAQVDGLRDQIARIERRLDRSEPA
ncbi:MAG: hypothetical protein SF002_12740 [Alphaproteobacteria bacterium]|nr:hypothetical protein [Alphaproteobacteria bacterium]